MASFFERLFSKDKDKVRRNERHNYFERVRQYYYDAGFTDDEIHWLGDIEDVFANSLVVLPDDPEIINLLARLVPPGHSREMFFGDFPYHHSGIPTLAPVRQMLGRIKNGEDLNQLINDLNQTLTVAEEVRVYGDSCLDYRFHLAYEVMQYPEIYRVFGSDPSRLGTYLAGIRNGGSGIQGIIEEIRYLKDHPNAEFKNRVLPKLTENDFKPFNGQIWLVRLLHHPEFLPLALTYYESDRSWAARLQILWDSFAAKGLPRVTDQEVDTFLLQQYARHAACGELSKLRPNWADLSLSEFYPQLSTALKEDREIPDQPLNGQYRTLAEAQLKVLSGLEKDQRFLLLNALRKGLTDTHRETAEAQPAHRKFEADHHKWLKEKMARARRRENPRHPLMSLGIAKTIGFEVEYPTPTNLPGREDYYDTMTGLGIKHGAGGVYAGEVSPGPFYDPETMLAVLRMYCDIGFIDFYRYTDLTCHFNLGIENKESFIFLIWNMYLAAAAYDPDNSHESSDDHNYELRIQDNNQGKGRYLEAKAFDAMTQPGLAWTLSSASYLGWASSAADDAKENRHLNRYRQELALIWKSHESSVRLGASKVGLGAIFREVIPFTLNQKLDRQIRLVYPDLPSRYLDPATVTERIVIHDGIGKVIKPKTIYTDGKHWPNIVAYTVDITNQTVAKIKEIEARVEADCVGAILEIETSPNRELREELLEQFIKDFAVALPDGATQDDKWAAYGEVRALF